VPVPPREAAIGAAIADATAPGTEVSDAEVPGVKASAPRRRQARGHQRMEQILEGAAGCFGDLGYDATTTNAIAARAGISPGSLYQFFPNKEAIAAALAQRYLERFGAAEEAALADDPTLPLEELLDRAVDQLVQVNVENPGLMALFARTDLPEHLVEGACVLHDATLERECALIARVRPDLGPDAVRLRAGVVVQIFKALIVPIVAAEGADREALVRELKSVLGAYLATPDCSTRCTS
jgi:AcrR family transcriptional regulator